MFKLPEWDVDSQCHGTAPGMARQGYECQLGLDHSMAPPKTAPKVRSDYQHATDIPKYSELDAMSFKARIYNVKTNALNSRSPSSSPLNINNNHWDLLTTTIYIFISCSVTSTYTQPITSIHSKWPLPWSRLLLPPSKPQLSNRCSLHN